MRKAASERDTKLITGVAALEYLARGWSVVPLAPGEKRPIVAWQRYQKQQPATREVKTWFRERADTNVAIVTGAVSGLLVLDVDPRHGGEASLQQLERQYGPLPTTPQVITGGGGRHFYFAHPGGSVRNRVGLMPGIDLRADGGLVVAPPSLHPSGRRYAWVDRRQPDDVALAPLPSGLWQELGQQQERRGHSLSYWRRLVSEGVSQGERNNSIASLAGHLLWNSVDPDVAMELLLCWNRARCRPPLDDEEVVRTVLSITRSHEGHEPGPE